MQECEDAGRPAVIACSALRAAYRNYFLRRSPRARFVFLRGPRQTLLERMRRRRGHFMPANLLDSQFEALEEPLDAVIVDVDKSPEEIVEHIIEELSLSG